MSQARLENALEAASRKRLEALRVVHSSLDRLTWATTREGARTDGLEHAMLLNNFINACQHFAHHLIEEQVALRRLIGSVMEPELKENGGETQ